MKEEKKENLLKLAQMNDEEVEKLDYKGKQRHYAARAKLCKIVHISRNKKGKGITFKKH